jgi:vWA-MoxR associated protein C-terminal domain/Trypsin-like peptidase domain
VYHRVAQVAAGTGFLIAPDLVLTCAHVVDGVDDADLRVEFPRWDGTGPVDAEVLDLGNPDRPEEDWAVLHLKTRLPLEPAEARPLAARRAGTGRLNVVGFPEGDGDTGWEPGWETNQVEINFESDKIVEIRAVSDKRPLRDGYSGAMVFADPDPAEVDGPGTPAALLVGMVVTAGGITGVGRMLPIPRLCQLWSGLPGGLRLVPFRAWDYLRLRRLLATVDPEVARKEYRRLARNCRVPELPRWVRGATETLDFLVTGTGMARLHDNLRLYLGTLAVGSLSDDARTELDGWVAEYLPEPADTDSAAVDGADQEVTVVRVDESGGGLDTYRVGVWRAGAGGEDPAEPVTMPRAEVRDYVTRQLAPLLDEAGDAAMVEFILPPSWLGEMVEEWPIADPDDPDREAAPLGWMGAVVVRDRRRADQTWSEQKLAQARRRWNGLMAQDAAAALSWYGCAEASELPSLLKWLLLKNRGAVALTRPDDPELASAAYRVRLPIVAWPRAGCTHGTNWTGEPASCPGFEFRRRLGEDLAGVPLAELPGKIRQLRVNADGEYGRLSLYWENPYRHTEPPPPLGLGQ